MPRADVTPERDSTLGLIFRLNKLWDMLHWPANQGDYDAWNNFLDRIFSELDYDAEYEPIMDKKGNVVDVKMENKDYKIFEALSKRVFQAKLKFKLAKNKKAKGMARKLWFQSVYKKDRWVRKFMMKKKLYLKEVEKRPGSAMFGSFGQKRK